MSNDIVERLRNKNEQWPKGDPCYLGLRARAANEIESQRTTIASLEAELERATRPHMHDYHYKVVEQAREIEALNAELFRLRTEHARLIESSTEVEIEIEALREQYRWRDESEIPLLGNYLCWFAHDGDFCVCNYNGAMGGWVFDNVTHWLPIPPLPTSDPTP